MRYEFADLEWTAIRPFGFEELDRSDRASDLTNISWIDAVATEALRAILTG
jgi:hypothetical protein